MLAQAVQQRFAAVERLLRSHDPEHLSRRSGRGCRERRDLRLAHDPEHHDVRGSHPQRLLDHVGNAGRVRNVGKPDDQRATLLRGHDRRRGSGVVRFDAV